MPKGISVDRIAVMQQVAGGRVPREGFGHLSGRPFRGGMRSNVEMEKAPSLVRQDDQDIENSKGDGRHHEEVRRDQLPRMVIQEGTPGLGGRFSLTSHVLRDGGLGHLDSEFEQLALNARCSPERISSAHVPNQLTNLRRQLGSPWCTAPTFPSPIPVESPAMPGNYSFGLDEDQR